MGQTPFLGDIMLISWNFPPKGWAFCNGQLLPINQNQALFSLLGTTYGGNGTTTFALPNLQGKIPIGQGTGLGLSPRNQGAAFGEESHTLSIGEIPAHTHTLLAEAREGDAVSPAGGLPAKAGVGDLRYGTTPGAAMGAATIGVGGGSQPHYNNMPYLCINYCIALQGIFPSRP